MSDAPGYAMGSDHEFTQDWFSRHIPAWDQILEALKPTRILEIGSFEGRSACYLIEKCPSLVTSPVSITCVDTWEGGIEHQAGGFVEAVMTDVERRFDHNTRLALGRTAGPVSLRKEKQLREMPWRALSLAAKWKASTSFTLTGRMRRRMC